MAVFATIRDVELAQVGTWNASTGVWECTREHLQAAVDAQADPSFRAPVLKVGHTDPRFGNGADGGLQDGEPAVGRVTNLRLSDDGTTLLGDWEQVPAWLAEIVDAAYPSRSVEMLLGVQTAAGRRYAAVLTAVALLGVTAPAIETLADVATLYQQPTAVDAWVAASTVRSQATTPVAVVTAAGSMQRPPGVCPVGTEEDTMPTTTGQAPAPDGRVAAAASVEELRRAYYAWAETQDAVHDSWICEVWTESLIVDDEDGRLWRVTWSETDSVFAFDPPVPVRRTYTPLASGVAAAAAHRMDVPVRYYRGRVDASLSTEETKPVTDISPALRERLGLAADADDDAVLAALDAALQPQTPTPTPTPDPVVEDTTTSSPAPVDDPRVADLVAAAVQRHLEPMQAALTAATTELASRREQERTAAREGVLAAALSAGKIAPAEVDRWRTDYDSAPDVVTRVLQSIAAGARVPVRAAGTVGAAETVRDEVDELLAELYGPTATKGA